MPARNDDDDQRDDDRGDDDKKPPAPATIDTKQLREEIRAVVAEVLDSGDDGGAGDDDDKGDAGDDGKGAPRSVAQVEDVSEDRVRRAVEKLAEEKEVRDRLTNVEKAIEKVPAKVRKITSAIWGKAEAS